MQKAASRRPTQPFSASAHPPRALPPRKACPQCTGQGQAPATTTRRELLQQSGGLLAAAASLSLLGPASPAQAGMERYVRKKELDPLETYVPLVLEARERLAGLDAVAAESPTLARQAMRSGPFNGLRDNIRALGRYASEPAADGSPAALQEPEAAQLVAGFFRALEDYDLVLYNAVREAKAQEARAAKAADGEAGAAPGGVVLFDQEDARRKLAAAVGELDRLITTVPPPVLARSRQVLEKVSGTATAS